MEGKKKANGEEGSERGERQGMNLLRECSAVKGREERGEEPEGETEGWERRCLACQ